VKKLLLVGGGIAAVIVTVAALVLLGWALIAGIGIVSGKLPHWVAEVEKIAGGAIEKARGILPGIEEKAKEVVPPDVTEKIKGIIPGEEIPKKDVSGEDIAGIPRYPNMVRVSFDIKDGKRTVGYKGKAEFRSVIDFYNKEMSDRGFKKKILSASPYQEVHEYRKARKVLKFSFNKADRLGIAMTEMVIREL